MFSLLIILVALACGQMETNNYMSRLIDEADTMPGKEAYCGLSNADAFRLGGSTWKDTSIIKYYIEYVELDKDGKKIINYFNNSDKKYISEKTDKSFKAWQPHIGIPIVEVDNKKEANLLIQFKLLAEEGIGGLVALSDFPPNKDEYTGNGKRRLTTVRMDLYDMWQYVKDRDKAKHKYETVLLHELGHTLASLSHNSEYSLMNTNNKFKTIQIDDAQGARTAYGKHENFDFGGNRYTWIENKNIPATLNFTQKELFSHCNNYNYKNGHFLSVKTIAGIQFIRTQYNCPIKILSSLRDVSCNYMNKGAKYSQHIFANGLDFKFVGKNAAKARKQYLADIKSKNANLNTLLLIGVKGFGSYPSGSFHVDSREVPHGNHRVNGIEFITWGLFRSTNKNAYQIYDEYELYD